MITYIGTGLLGANFVQAMLKHGQKVQVWNRTYEKAQALEQYGAVTFKDIKEAVKGASHIHMTLKDDTTVNDILSLIEDVLTPGTVIIDHTTTSAKGVIERTAYWKAKGLVYLHAPVFMGPKNALESTGFMLVSGDQKIIASVESELSAMTGKLLNFGEETGKAAAMKLIGNSFLVVFTAGLSDAYTLAQAQNVSVEDMLTLFESWNPAAASIPGRLKKISEQNFTPPSWELSMARKDTQLFINAVKEAGKQLSVIPVIAERMDKFIANGHGQEDWTVISKDDIS